MRVGCCRLNSPGNSISFCPGEVWGGLTELFFIISAIAWFVWCQQCIGHRLLCAGRRRVPHSEVSCLCRSPDVPFPPPCPAAGGDGNDRDLTSDRPTALPRPRSTYRQVTARAARTKRRSKAAAPPPGLSVLSVRFCPQPQGSVFVPVRSEL